MIAKKANIYDFDHTIYKGDASFDFIFYYMVRHPWSWRHLPYQLLALLRYIFGALSRKHFKERAFLFLRDVTDMEPLLEAFWKKNEHKIADWYSSVRSKSDIVISASPEFLLRPIIEKIGAGTLIATNMDQSTGLISGENCRGIEKVRRLEASGMLLTFNKAYSDSMSDRPMLALADYAYIVKGEKVTDYRDFKKPKASQLKSLAMIRFLFVGVMNAFIGVFLSYGISFLVGSPVAAFVMGYALSLVISYFLNSVITFMNFKFSVRQFMSFVVAYLPNFCIQVICVYILIGFFDIYPLLAYILAVVVAVPITFLLLSKKTFKQDGA